MAKAAAYWLDNVPSTVVFAAMPPFVAEIEDMDWPDSEDEQTSRLNAWAHAIGRWVGEIEVRATPAKGI